MNGTKDAKTKVRKAIVRIRGRLPLVAVILCLTGPAAAQHAAHVIPSVPAELLERPVPLRTGIGRVHDEVSTTSKEAQAFYDQGLAYLHSYVWIEAARSFQQALRLDPKLAMAHVGLSVAYVELVKPAEAKAALQRAKDLAAGVSSHDRHHIELRLLQAAAEDAAGDASKRATYRSALDESVAAFPRDTELLLLRGIAESPDPADRGQGAGASAVPWFERALTIAPDHFAAHHYLTHAFENAGRTADALAHGAVYARQAAGVPHARHMHGHNLRRAGRVADAIAEFEAADTLHRAYFAAEKVAAEYDWHHHHNIDLLASSYQYIGQMKKAEALLKAGFSLPSNLVTQLFNKRGWPAFLRSRGRNDEAYKAAQSLVAHPHPLVQATGHIESGYALLAVGRFADAAAASNTALRLLRGGAPGGQMAASLLLGLQGEISLRTAAREKARQVLGDVARRVRAAPGPDGWTQALFTLEAMARTARAVGDWELAGEVAQQMVEHDAGYAGSHYARALVAERNEDAATARQEFALAQKHWAGADTDLAELADIRTRLRSLK